MSKASPRNKHRTPFNLKQNAASRSAGETRRVVLPRRVDLHTHTNASDGEHSPQELVDLAREHALDVIAVADHDTVAGVEPALEAARRAGDIRVIPAVELSTDIPGAEIHILGYLIDWQDPAFRVMLDRFHDGRIGRAEKIAAKLADLGAPISIDRVKQIAGDGAIGRPHIAHALVEAGHVESVKEAFDRFLANDKPAYVEHYSLPPADAVKLILSAGGVPVLAHPCEVTRIVPELVAAGLRGIECYYADYNENQRRVLLDLARQYGLIATGGSDFHGLHKMGHMNGLGSVQVPPEVVERLDRAREAVVTAG